MSTTTTVSQAREIARQWVEEEAAGMPGFGGAFLHGSILWLADGTMLPENSDVDILVVLAQPEPPDKRGKFLYRGLLLEVSYLSAEEIATPERVLGQYHLAGSFGAGALASGILADPAGRLAELQKAVRRDYASRWWVHKRCEHARDRALGNLRTTDASANLPFHDQVTPWLFAAGVTTHILLVAGLKNPTVRTRYVAVRALLAEYGHSPFYESLLRLIEGDGGPMTPERTERHVAALAEGFDAAKAVIHSPYPFAADLSDAARPVAIDGSREMIARGDHREALFWIVATASRCQKVLSQDAPDPATRERYTGAYRELLADLGITSFADLQQRGQQVRDHLPRVWEVAEAILAANPGITE